METDIKCAMCEGDLELIPGRIASPGLVGYVYSCVECGAYVKEDTCTLTPAGTTADAATRAARMKAHRILDRLWKEGWTTKSSVYKWVSKVMHKTPKKTHIAMFTEKECETITRHAMGYYRLMSGKSAEPAANLRKPRIRT